MQLVYVWKIVQLHIAWTECGVFSRKDDDLTRWENEKVSFLNVYPWSVSLVAPGGMFAFCGGSLINDRYVLTSGIHII